MKDEEIIDILNRFHIQEYEWFIDDKKDDSFCSSSEEDSIKIEKAIFTLLERYKKQQKQIEEYKSGEVFTAKQMHYIDDNYIDKDYIREKIKELEWYGDYIKFRFVYTDYEKQANKVKIETLKELLEE